MNSTCAWRTACKLARGYGIHPPTKTLKPFPSIRSRLETRLVSPGAAARL